MLPAGFAITADEVGMRLPSQSLLLPYGVAVLATVLALLVRWPLWPVLGNDIPYMTFFPAIMAAAYYGGLWPGLLATTLSALGALYFLIEPVFSLEIVTAADAVGLGLFILVGIILSWLSEALHRARQWAEAAARRLQESEARQRITLANIGDAVLVTDQRGMVTFLNPVAERLTGWPQAEAVGLPLDKVFPIVNEQTRGHVPSPVDRVLREGTVVGLGNHTVLIARDGTERPIDDSAAPLRDAAGHITGAVLVFRDVTARRRAEAEREQLLEREQEARAEAERERDFIRQILDNAPIPIGVMQGPDHRVALVNPATTALTGVPPEQILGRPHAETFPDSHRVVGPVLDRVFQSGQTEICPDLEILLPDGRTVYLHVTFAPLPGPDGKHQGVLFLTLDRTEHRWIEQERNRLLTRLEAKRAFLEAVLRQMPGGVLIAEAPSGKVLFRNELAESLFGVALPPPTDLADYERYREFFPGKGNGGPDRWPLVRSLTAGEVVVGEQMEFRRADGSRGTIRVNAAPVRDAEGRLVAVVTTFFDVTEPKRHEDAVHFLAEAGAVLGSSLDHQTTLASVARLVVPRLADWCAVHIIDEDGTARQLAVAHADPAKVAWAEELGRRYPTDLNAPRGLPQVLRSGRPEVYPEITDDMLQRGARDAAHLEILRGLGLRSYMVVPLVARGRTLGALSFVAAESGLRYGPDDLALAEDLARRAALAVDNARLYREAQEADRRKDEFLALLGHELRNPLAPIRTSLHLLRLKANGDAAVRQVVGIMERQVATLVRLVDDLLDVSRITRGKVELRKEAVDVAVAVARAVETVRPFLDERRHRLEVAAPAEPLWVEADPARLEQVLANLLNNAGRYTEPGGQIRVAVERAGAEAVLCVRDNGIGIRAEMLPRVFDLFQQADRLPGRTGEGLGIGLTLVRRLVELHGGSITAASNGPGRGSEFTVRLALRTQEG
jgi:PAS domain S-box-containing protein